MKSKKIILSLLVIATMMIPTSVCEHNSEKKETNIEHTDYGEWNDYGVWSISNSAIRDTDSIRENEITSYDLTIYCTQDGSDGYRKCRLS